MFCSVVLDCYVSNFVSQFTFSEREKEATEPKLPLPADIRTYMLWWEQNEMAGISELDLQSNCKAFDHSCMCWLSSIYYKRTCQILTSPFLQIRENPRKSDEGDGEKMRLNVAQIKKRQKCWLHSNSSFYIRFLCSISGNTSAAIRRQFTRQDKKSSKETGRQQIRGGHIMLMRVITITW